MTLGVGEQFAGYTIVRRLGSGGMGDVYLAAHPRLPREDALKVLRPEISGDAEFRQRFIREADLAATLTHPHILTVHDRGDENGRLWIATQYIAGTDAAQLLRDRYPAGMPADDAIAIVIAVAAALDYAHDHGLLHRDVKPANILLSDPDRTGSRNVYLADFGIASPLNDPNGLTATNTTLGTFAYAAPEQLMGEALDGRADQYALAATAYHLLVGIAPFAAATNPVAVISKHLTAVPAPLSQHNPTLAALDVVLARGLAKIPGERYSSCADFAAALVRKATSVPAVPSAGSTQAAVTARADTRHSRNDTAPPAEAAPLLKRTPTTERRRPARRQRPLHLAIAVATVVGIGALIGWVTIGSRSAPSNTPISSRATSPFTAPAPNPAVSRPATPGGDPSRKADVAGMIVFLDPSGGGGNSSASEKGVPNGRGVTVPCHNPSAATESGYQAHTFSWDTVLRIRQNLHQLGVRTAMSRGNDDKVSPCGDERAALANSVSPNATVAISAEEQTAGSGFIIQYAAPALNAAQAGPNIFLAEVVRDQLVASGFQPNRQIAAAGMKGVSTVAELNLAAFPAIKVLLGNVADPADAVQMETPEGRQGYADAVVRGIVAFLQTQPPRPR